MTRYLTHQLEHVPPGVLQPPQLGVQVVGGGVVQRAQERIEEKVGLAGLGGRLVLGNDAVVDLLEVLLHLVRPGELLLTDRAGEDLPVGPLVVQKCVALEAVLVLEALHDLNLLTLYTAVRAVTCNVGIFEQIQPSDTHILQGLRVRTRLAGQVSPGPGVRVGRLNGATGTLRARPLLLGVAGRVGRQLSGQLPLSSRLSTRIFT